MLFSFPAINGTDIDAILEIERLSFSHPWNRMSFVNELSAKGACNYAVKRKNSAGIDQIIAYIFFRLIACEMHILKIAVAPKWRSQGVATRLIEKCFSIVLEKGCDKAFLEVRPSNIPAINFYNKNGFNQIGKRPNYFHETREDALVMIKTFQEEL